MQDNNRKKLSQEIVEDLMRRYRVDHITATEIVEKSLASEGKLNEIIRTEDELSQIKRTRVYKDAVAGIRRKTYYYLRQYNSGKNDQEKIIERLADPNIIGKQDEIEKLSDEIIRGHISTKERISEREEFYKQIFKFIDSPETILDVGCGVHPLLFPFESLNFSPKLYLAIDKNQNSIEAVKAFAKAKEIESLIGVQWDIKDGWKPLLKYNAGNKFDTAFLFKLIPVVKRQQFELMDILRETPAKCLIITGSTISLTKKGILKGANMQFCKNS